MATSPWQRLLLLLLHQWALSLPMHMASGMLYAPPTGSIWDPSCLRIGGRTHCIFMYSSGNSTVNGQHGGYPSGLLASADDGVHFRTIGQVAFEKWPGVGFFKAFVSGSYPFEQVV